MVAKMYKNLKEVILKKSLPAVFMSAKFAKSIKWSEKFTSVRYISDLLHWFSDGHLSWSKASSEWMVEIKNLMCLPLS